MGRCLLQLAPWGETEKVKNQNLYVKKGIYHVHIWAVNRREKAKRVVLLWQPLNYLRLTLIGPS